MPFSLRANLFPKKRLAELETLAFLAGRNRGVARQALEAEQRGQLSTAGADVFAATGEYWRAARRTSGGAWDERAPTADEHRAIDAAHARTAEIDAAWRAREIDERRARDERSVAAIASGPPGASMLAVRALASSSASSASIDHTTRSSPLDRVARRINDAVSDKVLTSVESDAILRSVVGADVTTDALEQVAKWLGALREHTSVVEAGSHSGRGDGGDGGDGGGAGGWAPYVRAADAFRDVVLEVPRDIRGIEGSGLTIDVAPSASKDKNARTFLERMMRGNATGGHCVEVSGTATRAARIELRLGGREIAVDVPAGATGSDVAKLLAAAIKPHAEDVYDSARRLPWFEALRGGAHCKDTVHVARFGARVHLEAYDAPSNGA